MELRHLRYAVAVADAGSFTKAAVRLHVVQQALSQQIADLERELGVRLFDRTAHGVVSTEAGAVFLREAAATLAHADRTIDSVRHHSDGAPPTLRVGMTRLFQATSLVVVAAVRRYHEAEPGVQIDLIDHSPDLLADSLLKNRLDVAFAHVPADPASDLDSLLVWEEPWTAVLLPSRHRLAARHPLWLRELSELPMIGFPPEVNPVLHARIIAALEERGLPPLLAPLRVSGVPEADTELVAAGLGWRLMVPSARSQFRGVSGVAFRSFADDPIPRLGLWAISHREEGSTVLTRFLAAVRACRNADDPAGPGLGAWHSWG